MKKTNIYKYYSFGYNYYLLQYGCLGINIHRKDEEDDSLQSRLDNFFEFLSSLELKVTEKAAEELRKIKDSLAKLPKDAKVDRELYNKILDIINKIDATLDAELKLTTAYILTEKRYDNDYLLKEISKIFGKNIFSKLPELCKYDFQEAGKAIAFSLPTAAAFHLMRGIEGMLRFYYKGIVKRGRISNQMWGPIIDHLTNRNQPPPKGLLDTLNNIKINYRNPTQHPEAKYDIDESQDLLSISVDAVNKMMKDLKSRGL